MNEFLFKILKVMFTLTIFTENNKNFNNIKFDILTSIIYIKAVRNWIWSEMLKNTVHAELTVLTVNEIWEKVVLLRNTNIVISK